MNNILFTTLQEQYEFIYDAALKSLTWTPSKELSDASHVYGNFGFAADHSAKKEPDQPGDVATTNIEKSTVNEHTKTANVYDNVL